jgi:predicted amidophosphoribosyltransferase
VLDVVFPLVCPGCGDRGAPLCPRCSEQLAPPVPAPPPTGVDAWCAPFAYEGAGRELVARVKYRNVRAVVPWLATAMTETVIAAGPACGAAVTWAPTTPARRRERGFDPAELLARAVGRRLGARCVGLLVRLPGPPQTGLAAAARRRGPIFITRVTPPARVLVVDDIATTGATLTAAAIALRGAGAEQVFAVTAARTPPPW